jgi:hypothetical protein
MKASTVPDDTVTRRGMFLMAFATFFIFFSPKLSDLVIELNGQRLVPGELEQFLPSHEVPVMVVVAVVVPEHASVIYPTDSRVDVRKAVPYNPSVLGLPHFFFEHCTASRSPQIDRLVNDLFGERFASAFPPHSPG